MKLFLFLCGSILGLCIGIAVHDFSMAAHAGETMNCRDKPDRKAYMARLPGENHKVEFCLQAIRFGSPEWIPDFQSPLKPRRNDETR